MHVVFVFIDGLGLGRLSDDNPLVFAETPFLTSLFQGNPLTVKMKDFHDHRASLSALDARLGVPGLPQSATGQASLFTGVNAPRRLGYHLNGFPNRVLRNLLAEEGIFAALREEGYRCTFANAYRPSFFEKLKQGLPGRRYSCSTLLTYYGEVPFYGIDELKGGSALYMDLTNKLLNKMGYAVPEITPEEAGKRLIDIGVRHDLTLFEYFITDYAGHRADRGEAGRVINELDRFLGAAADHLKPEEMLLIITSDHGNIEDLSHSRHTFNPVPALMIGAAELRCRIAPQLRKLTDIRAALRVALAEKIDGGG